MGVVGDILPFPYRGEWRRLREQIQSTSGSQTITKLSWSSGWPWSIGWCLSAMIIMLWYWWLETFLLGDPSWLPDFVFCVLFTPTNTTITTVREQDLDWHILGVGWFSGGDLGSEKKQMYDSWYFMSQFKHFWCRIFTPKSQMIVETQLLEKLMIVERGKEGNLELIWFVEHLWTTYHSGIQLNNIGTSLNI